MSGLLNSSLNSSASNLPESTGRPFTSSFSGQSGSIPGFHHSGLHNIHGSFNLPNMPGLLAQRNAAMSGLPSSGVQQPGGSISGRFTSNNLPVAMSQIPHTHSGVSGRGMNVGAGPAFSSSMNIGGNIQGLSSSLGAGGSRNSVPGMSVSPSLGNLGPRITSSVGNIIGGNNIGSNIGRNISSGGLSVPSIASLMNLSGNAASGSLNVQGSSRMMNGLLQQASPQLINMLGSSYPTSGGSLSQNQIQAGNNSLSSMRMLHDANDTAPFDINDFPQLTGRPSSAGGPQGQYGSLRKQGVGVNTIVQQNQEFSIQNEDFPALPGFKGNSSDYAMELHHKEQLHENVPVMQTQQYPMARSVGFNLGSSYPPNRQQHQQGAYSVQNAVTQNIGLRPLSQTPSLGSYDQLLQQYQQHQTQNPFRMQQMPSSAHSFRDQIQKIQGGPSPPDPYGLLGLLGVIRMNDAELASLALGIDLTTLGLNLNSPDNLYKTFGSPWSNEPAKGEPDFRIPACYWSEQTPPLQPILFQKLHILILFYIFYSMPKDEAQLYAAYELCNRGWFYHKELRSWLTRIPNAEPLVKTPVYERGSYGCFDPKNWETVRKDNFVLHYEQVEKRPALPSVAQNVRCKKNVGTSLVLTQILSLLDGTKKHSHCGIIV